MIRKHYELFENDLNAAIASVSQNKITERRKWVELFIEEYDVFDEFNFEHQNPVNLLVKHFADYGEDDISLFNLVFAEFVEKHIKANNEKTNAKLINCGIQAINNWRILNDKHELEEKRRIREIEIQNKNNAQELNQYKHKELNDLVARIIELYLPTAESLKNDSKKVTYFSIARRIEPKVRELNRQPNGRYRLGGNNDPVGAIKRRLEKAVRNGDVISTRELKKH